MSTVLDKSRAARGPLVQAPVALNVDALAKSFGATAALTDARLDLRAGEVHAVVGENGSGKSTLVKILSGVHRPDRGRVTVSGVERPGFGSPAEALAAGIATVYQEVLTVAARPVLENIWYGVDGLFRHRLPDDAKRARATELLTELRGEPLDLDTPAGALSLSDRQACGLVRALVRDPRILILDEATSALDVALRDRLFVMLVERTALGAAVVFISHRMDEIEQLGDRVTVMRSGATVGTLDRDDATPAALVALMTGADGLADPLRSRRQPRAKAPPVLRARGLRLRTDRPAMNLDVHPGELIGLAGLEGHGQDTFLRALWGLADAGGEITVDETPITSPRTATAHGIAYVPRERRDESLFASMSVRENFGLPTLGHDGRWGAVRPARTSRRLGEYVSRLQIKLARDTDAIAELSGGNQQKVVLARWLATAPRVLLLNDPTRGVDLNAKRDLYVLLGELARAGLAVVMLSTELAEHVELMDRVLVFRDHALAAELTHSQLSREALVSAFFAAPRP